MTKVIKTNKLILLNLIGDILKTKLKLKQLTILILALLLVGCKGNYLKESKLSMTERVYSFYTYDSTEEKLHNLVESLGYEDIDLKLIDRTMKIFGTKAYIDSHDAALFEMSTIIMYLNPQIDEILICDDGGDSFALSREIFQSLFYEFDRISEQNLESLFRSISLTSRPKIEVALAKSKLDSSFEKFKSLNDDSDFSALSYSVVGFIRESGIYNFYVYYRYSKFDLESSIYEKDPKEALVKIGIKANSLLSYEEVSNVLISERDMEKEITNTTDLKTISNELTKKNRDEAFKEYDRIHSKNN